MLSWCLQIDSPFTSVLDEIGCLPSNGATLSATVLGGHLPETLSMCHQSDSSFCLRPNYDGCFPFNVYWTPSNGFPFCLSLDGGRLPGNTGSTKQIPLLALVLDNGGCLPGNDFHASSYSFPLGLHPWWLSCLPGEAFQAPPYHS